MSVLVTWEEESLACVTLAWAERRNALGPNEAREVAAAFAEVADACAVVLRAQGPVFCAGGDLKAIAALAEEGREAVRDGIYSSFHACARAMRGLRGISIAAVDGGAVGLGADLALLCNVRFVGPGGWLDQGWGRIGLIPGTGGAWLIERLAGESVAWDFITSSGTRWDAVKLEARGLAVATAQSAEVDALERARRVARWPQATVHGYRALVGSDAGYDQHLAQCLELQVDLITSDDFRRLADEALGRDTAAPAAAQRLATEKPDA